MATYDKMPSYFKLDKLITDITECITSLSAEFSCMNIPIDDSCTTFHRFCAKLEHFLSLGLKEKSNLFGKKRGYWDYMLRCLVSNRGGVHEGLKFVKSNPELKTSVGRGRAFLRFCLVHQCLADALQQCISGASELTMEWYANWAPIRDEAALSLLITSLYDLNDVQFDLSSPSCHDLDLSWPVFNRKEFGSPFNWRAISRSASISSLTSSLSAVDTFNNSRTMGAMGSVQEGSEESGGADGDGERRESIGQGMAEPQENALRENSEEKDVWWMSEQEMTRGDTSQHDSAEVHSWPGKRGGDMEEQLRSLKEEFEGREEEWRTKEEEWERKEEEWRTKEGEWRSAMEEKERMWKEQEEAMDKEHTAKVDAFRVSEEERRMEVDMLKARVLELEVVNVMAKLASVGVQATSEDEESEAQKRIKAEEKLASICHENEELKRVIEQMRVTYKEVQHRCITNELHTQHLEAKMSTVSETKPQPNVRHDDDLRREYESQIRNVRELRGMYEERMKAAEEQSRKMREELQEKTRRLELSRRRCSELRAHSQELETLLGEQEGVARGLQARLSASLEEGRALAAQLATVNRLFGRLGDTAELDFERLRLLQNSCEGGAGEDAGDCGSANDLDDNSNKDDAGGSDGKEEVSELREIAVSLPKVWHLLVELLGEEKKEEEEVSVGTTEAEGCFDSVPTPYGPRLVISVSRTFIRLKDLILEKKTLQSELGRIRDLNGRLESKLKQQERRLATVKVELKRTWGLVARMRAQHKQLHTSEQVLRYELQQKRKLLGELKQELEYCREKWELARLKNSQSEKEWQMLRQEFTARRSVDGDPVPESTDVNSPESGFSDGRGEDEEEDIEGGVEGDIMEGRDYSKCSEEESSDQDGDDSLNIPITPPLSYGEENRTLPIDPDLHLLNGECNLELENSNPQESEVEDAASVVAISETTLVNEDSATIQSVDITSIYPAEDTSNMNVSGSLTTSAPQEGAIALQAGVSTERSMEERLHARAERLRRLEEQCDLLFRKVTRTTTRSAELSSRLEELHEQYGEQQTISEEDRPESSILADTETGETPPEVVPSSILRSQLPSRSPTPPPPPPLPDYLPHIRLPCLIDCHPCQSTIPNSGELLTFLPSEPTTSSLLPSNNFLDIRSESQEDRPIATPSEQLVVLEEERNQLVGVDASESYSLPESQPLLEGEPHNISVRRDSASFPEGEEISSAEEPRSASVTDTFVPRDEVSETVLSVSPPRSPVLLSTVSLLHPDSEEFLEVGEGREDMPEGGSNVAELVEGSGMEVVELEEEVGDEEIGGVIAEEEVDVEASVGLLGEGSTEGSVIEESEEMDDDAFIARMSTTIYGLHHGPLFDEGTSFSEEEDGEDIVEDDEEDDRIDEDSLTGSGVTSGSIGVASLLLQQLPKRMDILRRERHSLEQRLEEGEAALGRALAGTAAAERRARMLERGLAQAQERLRVLEMEAALERNERLLEIKSALDVTSENHAKEGNFPENVVREAGQSNSGHLQEEIDNLQRKTLAQIAEFQAAAEVSRAQKEQLSMLTAEVERQESIVRILEGELASLRRERQEQAVALEDARGRLNDVLGLLSTRQEESHAMQLQLDKLRVELDQSSQENERLFSQLSVAEAEVTRLNSEIEQLKDDSEHLQEAVIRLTGEKETLFRTNHHLEEMRRLVVEDSRWVSDRESETCTACGVTFSLMVRRHHCRSCGKIFCGACSSHWLALNSGPPSVTTSLVAGVVESLMGVAGAGKRSRACAECFAAYAGDYTEGEASCSSASCSQGGMHVNDKPESSKSPEDIGSKLTEGSSDAGLSSAAAEGEEGEEDDEDDVEDFSMISEEEVILSQCTPYVPNPRTLQYWKSCEIQSGVTSTVSDLLAACVPDGGGPGKGKGEEVWLRAGAIYSVPLLIEETRINILWEFSTNPNSIAFSVLYKSSADVPMSCALIVVPTTRVNSHLNPVHGRLRPKRAGVYILMFDNSFSRFTGKTISYCLRAEVPSKGASGRESVTSSSRSSVEPFPDLPIHPEEIEVSLERETNEEGDVSKNNDIKSLEEVNEGR